MNEEEIRRLVEITDKELQAAYELWMANSRESRLMVDLLFTKDEKKAWRKREPNFPNPIIH